MEQYHASKEALIKIPLDVFKCSFIIGTTLLVLYAIIKNGSLLLLGYYYVLIAVFTNTVVVIGMIVSAFMNPELSKKILLNTAVLFLNIPIAIAYIYIVLSILN